ncbi:MAG: hypothetical protein JWR08_2463 [Enterovirga sp.]|nr:hypothetical protein [Enterovirga sp.]
MSLRLPPLHQLRGFEAAARHLSFTRAANELSLTQGAISRQIRDLERHLGIPLFVRQTRRVELTPSGVELARTVRNALVDIAGTTAQIRGEREPVSLTLSVLPTLASRWLMPRLHGFTASHRDIDLRVITSIEPTDLLAHDADIAIKVGRVPGRRYDPKAARIELQMTSDWSGVHADELFPDTLVPVCAPDLLRGSALERPGDVLRHPLIHTTSRRFGWPDWFQRHGLGRPDERFDRLEFGHFFMSLEAARSGRGIALIPDILLSGERQQELVAPLPGTASAGLYYLLVHETRLRLPAVDAFRTWLLHEAGTASRSSDPRG